MLYNNTSCFGSAQNHYWAHLLEKFKKKNISTFATSELFVLPRLYLHLNVVGEFERFRDPESYAGGSVATGRDTQAGQVKG